MPVKIVTNSTSDIPKEIAEELDITIVAEYVVFGNKCYKDRIDISEDEFYEKLIHDRIRPTTSQPTPQDFLEVYNKLGKDADGILSIHIGSHLSGTIRSAEQAKKLTCTKCPIEIIDSKTISMALGIIVITAARMAKEGNCFQEIVDAVNEMLNHIHVLIMFDTLEYLARGGRIGKAKAFVGSLLKTKPLLTIRDGEFTPVLQAYGKTKAKIKLIEFVSRFENIEELCAVYSTNREETVELLKKITFFPNERIILSRLGPVIGAHAGPGLIAIAVKTRSSC
ncbi:MAG: DegV family protein [Dehalococcoidia bacterium]|nr:DegV family protein [Dehalococcoidia bacterium]